MKYTFFIVTVILLFGFNSCKKQNQESIKIKPEYFFASVDETTKTMIHDIFSPPQAARIYCYPDLAAYEIVQQGNEQYNSLNGQLPDFPKITKAPQEVNLELSALLAHIAISKSLIFTEDRLQHLQDSLVGIFKKQNPEEYKISQKYADEVVSQINEWIAKDHYAQTRTAAKYNVDLDDESRWQPTPPAYIDAVEPHWNEIRTLVLDSAQQFKPVPPPEFSLDKNSKFFHEVMEVYDTVNAISKIGDTSEGIQIAQFWDCNPYVSVTRGHFMFATKKITPGGHWVGITMIACRQKNLNVIESLATLSMTTIGLFDGFISCWDEKYRSNLVRPETVINKHIDESWMPILQTPPFPEYTSGHSVISAASGTILTHLLGENFSFADTSELPFGLPVRNFDSFMRAAREAAISRLYGGIHYRAAIEHGVEEGIQVGNLVIKKIKLKND